RRRSSHILQRSGRPLVTTVAGSCVFLQVISLGVLQRVFRRQISGVEGANALGVGTVIGEQPRAGVGAVIAETAREGAELAGAVGDLLDRTIVHDAQAVLEAAQKRVRLGERSRLF